MNKLVSLFQKPKIIGVVGNRHSGKSNFLYFLIKELEKEGTFNLYTYGLRTKHKLLENSNQRSGHKHRAINSIEELEQVTNSIIIVDELFSLFDLENRKVRKEIEKTIRLINHNNNVLVLCGVGENFKKFISSKLDYIIYKKITFADLINGSDVKRIIKNYKGAEAGSTTLNLNINEAIIYDGTAYLKINIPHLEEFDTKKHNKSIINLKSKEKSSTLGD